MYNICCIWIDPRRFALNIVDRYHTGHLNVDTILLLSAFPIRGRHSGFSFSSFSYQLYPPPSLQPQPCPLSPHP